MYDDGKDNELRLEKKFDTRHKIEIFNREGKRVENWTDLSSDDNDNKVKITLEVRGDGQESFSKDEQNYIKYYLKSSAKKSRAERDKALNEAHSRFLKKKKPDLIEKKQEYYFSKEIELILKGEPNNFLVELRPNNVAGSMKNIKNENIRVKVKFYLTDEITPEEIMNDFDSSPSSKWGWGKITLVVILSVILLLIIIFWKKIWRWIKGESKQEKKVREQIDIF